MGNLSVSLVDDEAPGAQLKQLKQQYAEIDKEIKKDIFKYKFKTTKTPIKLKIVPTKSRGPNSPQRNSSPPRKTNQ